MKNKILAVLGVLLIIASLGAWYAYTLTIKENSELLGKDIIVLAQNVKEGDPLTTANVKVKRIKQDDIVPGAISAAEGYKLNGKVAAIDLYTNEQITEDRTTIPEFMSTNTVRLVSLPISRPISVLPGDVKANDYIDIWDRAGGEPVQVLKNIRIVSLRDANNYDISSNPNAVPAALIMQANYLSEIIQLRKINESEMFITKSPNQTGIRLEQNTTEIEETPVPEEEPEVPEDEVFENETVDEIREDNGEETEDNEETSNTEDLQNNTDENEEDI